jgi:hypothetical protein
MKNKIYTNTDGVNVYARIDVNASKPGIYILVILLITAFILFTIVLSQMPPEEITSMAIPLLLMLILCIGLPTKYLLWNLFGSEELIVNSKSVSWSYDYGFFRTNKKTYKFDRLGTGFESVRGTLDNELGKLVFYNYREEDNLPELIHETTLLLQRKDIEELDDLIRDIFTDEFLDSGGYVPFSAN